jgi:hypothetical protein
MKAPLGYFTPSPSEANALILIFFGSGSSGALESYFFLFSPCGSMVVC